MSERIKVDERFAKKKVIEKKRKALAAMRAAKTKNVLQMISEENNVCDGNELWI